MLVPEGHRDRANGITEMGFPLAGVVASALAGLVYGVVGVTGVMAFDLFTFAVAVLVVFLIAIPRPPQSAEDRAMRGNFRREMLGGWHYLVSRRALLAMVVYISFIDFLINGPLEMALPYIISVTGSESTLGVLLGAMNLGALAGAAALALVGRVRRRMRVILAGYLFLGGMLVLCGVARHPVLLGAALFWVLFPLPLNGALFTSILQTKTPADLQGRVFAITGQMFMLMTPFSFLITAGLVDHVLEPAVGRPGWGAVAPLVGRSEGAGMGLLLVIVGAIIVVATLAVSAAPRIRRLESDLPDYGAEAEPQRVSSPGLEAGAR
jgi:MFS family permease